MPCRIASTTSTDPNGIILTATSSSSFKPRARIAWGVRSTSLAPRGMIIPPQNDDLRGTEVQVWVFVDTRGRVVADSTRLDPPTRDRGFNRRLIREAAEWVFRPAVQEGKPVASWFPYRISM